MCPPPPESQSVYEDLDPDRGSGGATARSFGPRGELRFVGADERVRLRGALEAGSLLVINVEQVTVGDRGRLADVIDDAIETALHDHGASAPGIVASSEGDAALADQLYRVRRIGRVGIAIALPSLAALQDARGVLDADDGATLRLLAHCTHDRPLVLLLDVVDAHLRVYGAPEALTMALSPVVMNIAATPFAPSAPAIDRPREIVARAPQISARTVDASTQNPAPSTAPPTTLPTTPMQLVAALELVESVTRATPLSGLERAFVEGYAPLRAAWLEERTGVAGLSRHDVRAACDAFVATFGRAYSEALPTFGVTGKHPRMIFDLFSLTQRCARVHGARTSQIVLIDALRWDVGARLRTRLGRALSTRAALVEELPLWSTLPTTTSVQLDALSRGEDALRAPIHPERETAIIRGRSLDVLRRMHVGHRDILKLDTIEGRIRDAGTTERQRLDALADELATILARHIDRTPVRTLVIIAGDHGFRFDAADERSPTTPALQGGASPDEVFVPFQAWLVGGVH